MRDTTEKVVAWLRELGFELEFYPADEDCIATCEGETGVWPDTIHIVISEYTNGYGRPSIRCDVDVPRGICNAEDAEFVGLDQFNVVFDHSSDEEGYLEWIKEFEPRFKRWLASLKKLNELMQ